MDRVGRLVQLGEGLVEDDSEFFEPRFIGGRIDRDDFFAGGGGEDFAESDAPQVSVFMKKPADKLGGVGFFLVRKKR